MLWEDCAYYEDAVSGKIARPRANNAVRQARISARNFIVELLNKKRPDTRYRIQKRLFL